MLAGSAETTVKYLSLKNLLASELFNLLIDAINALLYKFKSVSPSNESPIKRYLVLPVELGLPIT